MVNAFIQPLAPGALRTWFKPLAFSPTSSFVELIHYKCALSVHSRYQQLAKSSLLDTGAWMEEISQYTSEDYISWCQDRLKRSEDDPEVLRVAPRTVHFQVGELACDRTAWKHSCATPIPWAVSIEPHENTRGFKQNHNTVSTCLVRLIGWAPHLIELWTNVNIAAANPHIKYSG